MASSTALNCFNNSSRRVVFDDDDDEDALGAVVAPADGLVSGITTGERFFDGSTFLLDTDFLSITGLSLDRDAFFTTVRRAVLDELLELDEYDEPDSEPLESDDPESVELDRLLRLSLVAGLRGGIGDDLFLLDGGLSRDARLSAMGGDIFRFLPNGGGVRLAVGE